MVLLMTDGHLDLSSDKNPIVLELEREMDFMEFSLARRIK